MVVMAEVTEEVMAVVSAATQAVDMEADLVAALAETTLVEVMEDMT